MLRKTMRWRILRVLLYKEARRHLANRGGLALLLLLVVAALLLSFGGDPAGGGLAPGVRRCYVDYWEDGPLVEHLKANVPPELRDSVRFRPAHALTTDADGVLVYPPNTGAIQIRSQDESGGLQVSFWSPGSDGAALAPYEAWFWRETYRFHRLRQDGGRAADGAPPVRSEHAELRGGMDARSGMATALTLFGLFFVCVYLLPSLTCEERERGVLLAQALSPASPREILAAKFLFYPVVGLALGALLAGLYKPAVLTRPFFWLAVAVAAAGGMGVGLTVSALARTQRAASMGALCYMLAVALLLIVCRTANVPGLSYLALEYHCPRMLHAALTDSVSWHHWGHLAAASVLAAVWTTVAATLFRRCGWQ
jgi:branched-subunit amino acid transport protein